MRKAVDLFGRTLVSCGLILLLFVVFQVWGTDLIEAREQRGLKSDFRELVAAGPDAAPPRVVPGDAVALIEAEKIGLERAVVEGVGTSDLRKGPGHYPDTVLPGQKGNAAIAGHRTTYGGPFNRLDELRTGDAIEVTTVEGRFVYRVREKLIVTPATVQVLDPTADAVLTLTTCHPKYSARQRLVVVADLDPRAGREATQAAPRRASAIEDLDAGNASGWDAVDSSTVVWLLALVFVAVGWWLLHRGRRHWSVTLVGALPFLGVLFFVFAEIEELLPANF